MSQNKSTMMKYGKKKKQKYKDLKMSFANFLSNFLTFLLNIFKIKTRYIGFFPI